MDYKACGEKPAYKEIQQLETQFGLPLYLYDTHQMIANAEEIKGHLGDHVRLCYCAKANYDLAEAAAQAVDLIEVSTAGELRYCLAHGIAAERLVYSGVWKPDADLAFACQAGVGRIILDSLQQLKGLQKAAQNPGEVLLRLSSGDQFGMNVEEIKEGMKSAKRYGHVRITGIQYYAGTQRSYPGQVRRDIGKLREQLQSLKAEKILFEELQIGGGIGVPLFVSDRVEEFEEAADCMFAFVKELSAGCRVVYECGRGMAANAGLYLTQVFARKQRAGGELLLVRGGSHHLNYYGNICGQRQPFMESVTRKGGGGLRRYKVCGSLCSAGDILAREYTDCCIKTGDYLLFYNAGAYSLQEAASLFLTMEMPRILLYNKDREKWELREWEWKEHEYTNTR